MGFLNARQTVELIFFNSDFSVRLSFKLKNQEPTTNA